MNENIPNVFSLGVTVHFRVLICQCLYMTGYFLQSFMQKNIRLTYCDCWSGGFSRKQMNSWMALSDLWKQPCMALLTLWPWSYSITDALYC